MAETITRQLREPFVESAGLGITDRGLQLLKTPIPTATYTGRQFVQDQSALDAAVDAEVKREEDEAKQLQAIEDQDKEVQKKLAEIEAESEE